MIFFEWKFNFSITFRIMYSQFVVEWMLLQFITVAIQNERATANNKRTKECPVLYICTSNSNKLIKMHSCYCISFVFIICLNYGSFRMLNWRIFWAHFRRNWGWLDGFSGLPFDLFITLVNGFLTGYTVCIYRDFCYPLP